MKWVKGFEVIGANTVNKDYYERLLKEKNEKGAGIISSKAAFGFGVGLVSAVSHEKLDLPYHIVQTQNISENCTAMAVVS